MRLSFGYGPRPDNQEFSDVALPQIFFERVRTELAIKCRS